MKKKFSILGASVSTLEGYNPSGFSIFYEGENCVKSGVKEITDTWWGKVIDFFDGELLVNNSWSGSRVTRFPNKHNTFPAACSEERTNGLHIYNNIKPNIIIVHMGTNDWAYGVEVDVDDTSTRNSIPEEEIFSIAYDLMIKRVMANYPDSEIWCCNLNITDISSKAGFSFPPMFGGKHIEEYNNVIEKVASGNKCILIDLYNSHISVDTIDGFHPNRAGMDTLAKMIIHEIMSR